MKDLKELSLEELIALVIEQEKTEKRGRIGPLGGNKYDSRDVEEAKDRVNKIKELYK